MDIAIKNLNLEILELLIKSGIKGENIRSSSRDITIKHDDIELLEILFDDGLDVHSDFFT